MQDLDELDRLAAEKVMGWKEVQPGLWDCGQPVLEELDEWQPTRNISHAWQLIEKLSPRLYTIAKSDSGYDIYLNEEEIYIQDCETISLTIVKACLKAKEENIE